MARVKIDLPKKWHFITEIILRVDDMNYGNHLGNEKILILAHECRLRFLQSFGCSEFDVFGASIIQADAAIVYKSEGHIGDLINARISVQEVSKSSFELYYLFENTATGKVLAQAKTGMVFYDYKKATIVKTPDMFLKKIG
jgi:acyl-CoA thioesterase FadM